MTTVISAARPLFPWYGNDLDVIRQTSPAMHTQWQAMTAAQRVEAEATARRVLLRVGLGTPEDEKWLRSGCEPGGHPGIPLPMGTSLPRCVAMVADGPLPLTRGLPPPGPDHRVGGQPLLAFRRYKWTARKYRRTVIAVDSCQEFVEVASQPARYPASL